MGWTPVSFSRPYPRPCLRLFLDPYPHFHTQRHYSLESHVVIGEEGVPRHMKKNHHAVLMRQQRLWFTLRILELFRWDLSAFGYLGIHHHIVWYVPRLDITRRAAV
jgi:hypothetical protein